MEDVYVGVEDTVCDTVWVVEGDAVGVDTTVPEQDRVWAALRVKEAVRVPEADPLWVCSGERLRVTDGLRDGRVQDPVHVGLAVGVTDGGLAVVKEAEEDSVGVVLPEGLPLQEPVLVACGVTEDEPLQEGLWVLHDGDGVYLERDREGGVAVLENVKV